MSLIVSAAIFVGSFIVSAYLRNRDREEFDRPSLLHEWGVPHAREGAPIPVLFGKYRVTGPAVTWMGSPVARVVEIDGEQVAWNYFLQFMLATCLPCDPGDSTLWKIYIDDREIYGGGTLGLPADYYNNDTELTYSLISAAPSYNSVITQYQNHIDIHAGYHNFYGGKAAGGGLNGKIEWLPGATDQFLGPWQATALAFLEAGGLDEVSLHPPYRRMSGLYFDGINPDDLSDRAGFMLGESGRFPNISTVQSSYPDALGYGAIGDDANPAEVLYAILTDAYWGRGISTSDIDTTSFQTAAATLETEELGYSQVVGSLNDLGTIIDELKAHAGMVLYEDLSTRKLAVQLIRDDYDLGLVPSFDESNICKDRDTGEAMIDYTPGDWAETINQVIVMYSDAEKGFENSASEPAVDDAAVNASGEPPRTAIVTYSGCTNATLAAKLAYRDLRVLSLPLARLSITVNRDGYSVRPGDVIAVSWSRYGLANVGFRVVRVNLGSRDDSRVTLDCVEEHYVFGQSIFPPPDYDLPVSPSTGDVSEAVVEESFRWLNIWDTVALSDPETPRLMYIAAPPASGTNESFDAHGSDDDGVTFASDRENCLFRQTALVYADYDATFEPYDTTTGLTIYDLSSTSVLKEATSLEIQLKGANLIKIGDELISYESYTDLGSGVYRLNNVWRGMADTRPADHSSGDRIWFLNPRTDGIDYRHLGRTARSTGDDYVGRAVSRNAWGRGSLDDAIDFDVTTVNRAARPSNVDDLEIGGLKSGTLTEDYVDYTWNRRTRTASFLSRGDQADDPLSGDLFRAQGRILGDGEYTPSDDSLSIISNDIDAATISQPHGLLGHGDAELMVTAFYSPYPWLPSFELEDYQSAKWTIHLARYRQMLANPSWTDGASRWTIAGDTPTYSNNGVTGASGALGGTGQLDYTATQDVDVRGFATEGLVAWLRGYRQLDSLNSQETYIDAIDGADTPIGAEETTGADLGSGWETFDLSKTLPDGTQFVRIRCESVNDGGTDPIVSNLDLRIGHQTDNLVTNPSFDSNLTGWTTASGTWGRNTSNYLVGGASLECQSTGANDELYEEYNIDAGFELGTAILQFSRRNFGSDELKAVLEARTSGGSVVDSVETESTLSNDGEWHITTAYLDLDDPTIAKLRLRWVSTSNASGNNSMLVDEVRLHIHKELHPTNEHVVMTFDNTPAQVFPERAVEWVEDYSAPSPSVIYTFDETAWPVQSKVVSSTPSADNLTEVGSSVALLDQVFAGVRNAAESYAWKSCMETVAGSANGATFSAASRYSIDGENDWTVTISFKAIGESDVVLMGSYDGAQGWDLTYQPGATGQLRLRAVGSSTVNIDVKPFDYGDAVPHYATVQYNSSTGMLSLWAEGDTASAAVPTGDASNAVPVRIGANSDSNSGDAQIPYFVGWDVATVTKVQTDAWWAHGGDPTGELTEYDSIANIGGTVDSDSDGAIASAYSAKGLASSGQVAIFEHANLTTHGRGLARQPDLEPLTSSDPMSAEWVAYNSITKTDRASVDARRMTRSVELTGSSTQWLKSDPITKAAGDIVVVAYLEAEDPMSGADARIVITDDSDNVIDSASFDHETIDGWTRVSAVLSWDGSTSDLHVGFSPSDGSSETIRVSGPIGVFYAAAGTGIVPSAIPLADMAGSDAVIKRDTALDARFNHEGEVSITGLLDDSSPSGVALANLTNGVDDDDRRYLAASGGGDFAFSHYDGSGSGVGASATGPTWTDEWTLRARWNTAAVMEDAAAFSRATTEGVDDTDGRGSAWTPGSTALDEAEFLGGVGGLLSQIVISSRELPP